jgi:hypothetical protein
MARLMRISLVAFFVAWMFAPFSAVLSQDSLNQVAKQLAGTRGREWIFVKFETFMGVGNHCKQGESYRFKANHQVTISRCVNGQVQNQTVDWTISSEDALDTWIRIGDDSYLLKFWETAQGHFMALRQRPDVKTKFVVDKTFHLAED